MAGDDGFLIIAERTISVEELLQKIVPVVRFDGKLHYIKKVDQQVVYTYYPMRTSEADDLEVLAEIPTSHPCYYHANFPVSLDEVAEQIPAEYRGEVVAVEVIIPNLDDPSVLDAAFQEKLHRTKTILYKRKSA